MKDDDAEEGDDTGKGERTPEDVRADFEQIAKIRVAGNDDADNPALGHGQVAEGAKEERVIRDELICDDGRGGTDGAQAGQSQRIENARRSSARGDAYVVIDRDVTMIGAGKGDEAALVVAQENGVGLAVDGGRGDDG